MHLSRYPRIESDFGKPLTYTQCYTIALMCRKCILKWFFSFSSEAECMWRQRASLHVCGRRSLKATGTLTTRIYTFPNLFTHRLVRFHCWLTIYISGIDLMGMLMWFFFILWGTLSYVCLCGPRKVKLSENHNYISLTWISNHQWPN